MSQLSEGLPVRKLYFRYKSDLYYIKTQQRSRYSRPFIIAGSVFRQPTVLVKGKIFRKVSKTEGEWNRVFTSKIDTKDNIGVHDADELSPTQLYNVLMCMLHEFIAHIEPWAEADWPTLEVENLGTVKSMLKGIEI
jgi:hypothetical protein